MKKISTSALVFSMLVSTGMGAYADTYKNSILDLEFKKELNNTVSVTVYTGKPYSDNVFVTKRDANTHVLLFPETDSNLKDAISIAKSEGLIKNFDIKTQPYNDQNGKGYTKITLTTMDSVSVLAQTELYKTVAKPASTTPQTLPPPPNAVKPAETKVKGTTSSSSKNQKFDIIQAEKLSKDVSVPKSLPPKTALTPPKASTTSVTEPVAVVAPKQQIQEKQQAQNIQQVQDNQQAQQVDIPAEKLNEYPILNAQDVNVDASKSNVYISIFENKWFWIFGVASVLGLILLLYAIAIKKMKEITGDDNFVVSAEVEPKKEHVNLQQDQTMIDEKQTKLNLYKLLNSADENNGEDVFSSEDYVNKLEKLLNEGLESNNEFTSEVFDDETSNSEIVLDNIVIEEQITEDELNDIDEMSLDKIDTEVEFDDIVIETSEEDLRESDEEVVVEPSSADEMLFVDNQIESMEEEISEENEQIDVALQEQVQEIKVENEPETLVAEDNLTEPQNAIDGYMRYLVANPEKLSTFVPNEEITESLMNDGIAKEELNEGNFELVENEEDILEFEAEITPEPLLENSEEQEMISDNQEEDSYNFESSDFDLNLESQDTMIDMKENFDEEFSEYSALKEPESFSGFENQEVNSLFEQNNEFDIFEETEVISSLSGDVEEIIQDAEPIFAENEPVFDLAKYQRNYNKQDDEEIVNHFDDDFDEEFDEDNVDSIDLNVVSTPQELGSSTNVDDINYIKILDDGLKVISEAKIRRNAGLYLVDFNEQIALVGYKNDNYFVLKSFDETPKGNIQVKLAEKEGRTEQYLVKIGKDKMFIELNSKQMKHLMDL